MERRDANSSKYVKKKAHSARKTCRMNVSQKKSLTLQTEFAECALRDYFPSRGCDAALVKMVWQNVDQSKRKSLKSAYQPPRRLP